MGWASVSLASLYKNRFRYECSDYRDISLLAVVDKVHSKLLIEKIREDTNGII